MRTRTLLASLLLAVPLVGVLAPAPAARAADASAAPVGGSYLASVYTDRGPGASQRLVLVAATGGSSTVLERRVSRRYAGFTLVDWSVDGRTALLTGYDGDGSWVDRVDVTTGAVQRLRVRRLATVALDPAGTGLLATTWESRVSNVLRLDRIAWSGARTRLPIGTNGTLLTSPDGTLVLTGTPRGGKQRLVSLADGSVRGVFRHREYCGPVRWWDQTRVLETCGDDTSDLVLVDPAAGTRTRLTDDHADGDYGHYDGRQLGDTLYVEVQGSCKGYVGRLEADGSTRRVRVPGTRGQVFLVDAVGSELVVQLAPGCNASGERAGLSRFDPVTRVETPLLRLPRREELTDVLTLGETRATAY